MTVFVWRVLSCVSAGLFVAIVLILLCMRLLRNRYYHSYEQNELIKNVQTSNSRNSVFFTSGETYKYIKKYVICKTLYDKFLVCNFTRNFKDITYFVIQYTARHRVSGVLRISEYDTTGDSSKIISLNRNCAYVNVVVGTVDGTVINTDVIRRLSVNKIRLFSFLRSFALFLGLFAFVQALVEIIAGDMFISQYLSHLFHYIAVAAAFVLSVIEYFISVKCYRGKNVKGLSGGALEYDFL